MTEPCNYDSPESKFLDKILVMKASDCFQSCISSDSGCTLELLENDPCDSGKNYAECNKQDCAWDFGNCGYCAKNCFANMLENGVCDAECNTEECWYDLNDCGLCTKNCKIELINNGICNLECYSSECEYDGKDCGCAPNCKFEDYGKCKSACMVPDCNYDSMGTQCQNEDLRKFYQYFQLLKHDFAITQNIDFLNCSSNSSENFGIYSLYCPIYELYKNNLLIKDNYCSENCLKCTNFSSCVDCDYSKGYSNYFTQRVLNCPTDSANHPLIPSICYKNTISYSYQDPKKIYVDYNATNSIQNGSQEYPYKTLYDAINNTDISHIEILLKPGIHEINYEIPINSILVSMIIEPDCSNCSEYAFLSITNKKFSFPTYEAQYITFVNLIIDREAINIPYQLYFPDASADSLVCPEVHSISLIEINSLARFYAINTTFSNIQYNVNSIINADGGTIKLYNINFINIKPFNCLNKFSVINLWCFDCNKSDFIYDTGIASLNNEYFSNFMNFASSFLFSESFSNIRISNVEFSNVLVLEKWGASSSQFMGCRSLFCAYGCKQIAITNNRFYRIYSLSSVIFFKETKNYQALQFLIMNSIMCDLVNNFYF